MCFLGLCSFDVEVSASSIKLLSDSSNRSERRLETFRKHKVSVFSSVSLPQTIRNVKFARNFLFQPPETEGQFTFPLRPDLKPIPLLHACVVPAIVLVAFPLNWATWC